MILTSSLFIFSYSLAEPAEDKWKTHAELSFVQTGGNTDTEIIAGTLEVTKKDGKNRYLVNGNIIKAETDNTLSSSKRSLDIRIDRFLTEKSFAFLTAGYSKDDFAGFDSRIFAGPGYGYELIKTQKHNLLGLGYILYYSDHFVAPDADGEDDNNYTSGKVTIKYVWLITSDIKFNETLDYFVSFKDSDRAFIDSSTTVSVKISKALSFGINYTLNHQTEPPSPDLKKTDSTVLLTLIIDF